MRQEFIVRALPSGREIEGVLAMWGKPTVTDCYGTYFDRQQAPQLGLMVKGGAMIPVRLMYEHGMDETVGKTIIGMVDDVWAQDDGLHFHAALDTTQPHHALIVDEIRKNELAVSSASAEHLAEFDTDGRFVTWLLSEISLTKEPCEPRMAKVAIIRSVPTAERDDGQPGNPIGDPVQGAGDCGCEPERTAQVSMESKTMTNKPEVRVSMEELGLSPDAQPQDIISALIAQFGYDAVKQAMDALAPAVDSGMTMAEPEARNRSIAAGLLAAFGVKRSDADELAALRKDFNALRAGQMLSTVTNDQPTAPRNREEAPRVESMTDRKFDHASTAGMALMHNYLFSRGKTISAEFQKALHYRIARDVEKGIGAASSIDVINTSPYRSASDVFRHSFSPLRANEIDNTGATAKGIEWVGAYYDSDYWEVVRIGPVWESLKGKGMEEKTIPRGYSSDIIPIEGADLTWYTTAETTTVDATNRPNVSAVLSNIGTGSKTITLKKLMVATSWSGEQDEDSLIAMADEANRKMQVQGQEQLEFIMINGDTVLTANTNINLIDGTPTTQNYTVTSGFMYNALLGVSGANARDGGALDKQDYRILKTFLGTAGKAGNDVTKLVYLIDTATHDASLDIPELSTIDVSSVATIESGVLKRVYGIDILTSGQIGLANTAGKISATPSNNTKGRILLVRPDQWKFVYKRQLQIETERYAMSDATVMVGSLRFGMVTRDADSASSVSYNLTV